MGWVRKDIQTARRLEFSTERGQKASGGEGAHALERSYGFEVRYPIDEWPGERWVWKISSRPRFVWHTQKFQFILKSVRKQWRILEQGSNIRFLCQKKYLSLRFQRMNWSGEDLKPGRLIGDHYVFFLTNWICECAKESIIQLPCIYEAF